MSSSISAAGGAQLRLRFLLDQISRSPLTGWARFLLRRLASSLVTLVGISTVTFVMVRLLGNPVYLLVGQQSTKEIIDAMTKSIGLDQPIWVQYLRYLSALLHGDLGISRATFRPVAADIAQRLPATLELVVAAMVIVICVAVPLGVAAAARRGRLVDRLSQFVVQFTVSVPAFWFGLILIFVFFAELGWLPAPLGRLDRFDMPPPAITGFYTIDSLLGGQFTTFLSTVRHLALPAVTLALIAIPASLQITRASMIQVLDSRYIRTARALGLSGWTIYSRYALKNVLLPLLTVLAMTFGFLMSSTVLVEVIFSWPGIGLYAVTAMNQFDYEPIQAVVILSATFYIAAYFVADILSATIDPRVRV